MGNVPLKIFAKSWNLCSEKGTNPMYASHLGAIEQGGGGGGVGDLLNLHCTLYTVRSILSVRQ